MPFVTEYRTNCQEFVDCIYGDSIIENHEYIKNMGLSIVEDGIPISHDQVNENMARFAGQIDNRKDKKQHHEAIYRRLHELRGQNHEQNI